ncbi:MAG: hypothetical protein AAGG51_00955 [Cyanobacteria bacterium P01_G01_bin.54]
MVQPLLETEWSTMPPVLLLPTPPHAPATPSSQSQDFPKAIIPGVSPWQPSTSTTPLLDVDAVSANAPLDPPLNEDPLNSPHPIPWNWILETYETFRQLPESEPRHYRTLTVVSPEGDYAAYSRIQMSTDPEFLGSQITSVMFLEDLRTGELQTVTASSPIAHNPSLEKPQAGVFSILIPISWSQTGDRLLARQFEGLLSTSIASDYAVIWERSTQQTFTCVPKGPDYSNAIVLGWSTTHSEQVLFRIGSLGEDPWLLWRVSIKGDTALATGDQPIVFGQIQSAAWGGAQLSWS